MSGKYAKIYDSSIKNKENFWKEVAEDIFWYKKPSKILNSSNPSVGLLNVGEESQKGNSIIQDAATLLNNLENKVNYYGFVEGNDIAEGNVDVIITDGFSGNIARGIHE